MARFCMIFFLLDLDLAFCAFSREEATRSSTLCSSTLEGLNSTLGLAIGAMTAESSGGGVLLISVQTSGRRESLYFSAQVIRSSGSMSLKKARWNVRRSSLSARHLLHSHSIASTRSFSLPKKHRID